VSLKKQYKVVGEGCDENIVSPGWNANAVETGKDDKESKGGLGNSGGNVLGKTTDEEKSAAASIMSLAVPISIVLGVVSMVVYSL
jgi:hypothetical protein